MCDAGSDRCSTRTMPLRTFCESVSRADGGTMPGQSIR